MPDSTCVDTDYFDPECSDFAGLAWLEMLRKLVARQTYYAANQKHLPQGSR